MNIGDNYLTVGFVPDRQYLIKSVEVLINKTSYEQKNGECLGDEHEGGLVAHTLTDYINNYTDGQGYVDNLVWSNLFPKVKTSMATGRFGSKTKGLFIRKHGLYDQVGCHIVIGDGQDKNHKTVIRELHNGDFFPRLGSGHLKRRRIRLRLSKCIHLFF